MGFVCCFVYGFICFYFFFVCFFVLFYLGVCVCVCVWGGCLFVCFPQQIDLW